MTPLRYSDLNRDDIACLRILTALEEAYPNAVYDPKLRRPSAVLAGYEAWRTKRNAA